ncbi:retrovirus-related pol polyprotein from transposon TNT 1-94 [Tanacetum coccineum]
MLRAFPVPLTGALSRWLRNQPSGSITTWEILKTKFLNKYCPHARTAKKIKEINNFQQDPDESLFRAWERFKELLMKCPQHYLTDMQEVILFYNGLDVPTRQILDSKGAIPSKTAVRNFNYDTEREKYNKAKLENRGYERALESLEARILGHEKNELAWGERYEFQNYDLKCREIKINNLNMELEKVVKERDDIENFMIEKWEGLDEYTFRNKNSIESKGQSETNKMDEVIIEDWTLDDEDDVCADKTVSSVNVTQAVRSQADKSDCDFYDQKSPEPSVKNVVNIGKRVVKPVWDYGKRVNHQNFSKNWIYPHPKRTFNPSAVLTIAGLVNTNRSNVSIARSISTVRPVSIARPLVSKIAQSNSVIRPNNLRLKIVRPKASNSRSYNTQPVYRTKDLKTDVKNFGVKNMTTVGTRVVVSKSKVENVLKKAKWVWRPKMNYQDHVYKYNGSYMLKKFEYVDPKGISKIMEWWIVYLDKHNMVAFLKKPNESVGFTEVVDFLKGTSLRTLVNGTQQLIASIDSKEYTITEASVRSKLQLADATGIHNLSNADIYAGLATLGYVTQGAVVDQGEGSTQPANPHLIPVDPIPSTSHSPHPSPQHQSPPHSPLHHSPYQSPPILSFIHTLNLSPHFYYQGLEATFSLKINSLEKELKDTKQTLGNAVIKLVKKVKTLETTLKRKSKKVLISESAVSLVRESMKEKSTDFVTPTKASGEAQEEELSPIILEAAKILSKVASQGVGKEKSTDKGKIYRRRARSMAKNIDTGLDAEEENNTGREEINTCIEEVSTSSTKVDSGTASKRGQREGKAPMVKDDI